jgi:REP element-mobilizing transposase RayT
LIGALPKDAVERLLHEASRINNNMKLIVDPEERRRRADIGRSQLFDLWDQAIDTAQSGPFWLKDPLVAALVADSIHHRDGRVYDLDAFCIMSNHVHAVFAPLIKDDGNYHSLSAILHSLKLYTARKANSLLNRKGSFWHPESYDHVVRNDKELERVIQYVLNNPVKAGLAQEWEEWPWTYCKYAL